MNKCKDCRFAAAPREHDGWSHCYGVEFEEDAIYNHWSNKKPRRLAIVVDGSGYSAGLLVSPDFGCAHWEAKTP